MRHRYLRISIFDYSWDSFKEAGLDLKRQEASPARPSIRAVMQLPVSFVLTIVACWGVVLSMPVIRTSLEHILRF
jgi:hypothetical protein